MKKNFSFMLFLSVILIPSSSFAKQATTVIGSSDGSQTEYDAKGRVISAMGPASTVTETYSNVTVKITNTGTTTTQKIYNSKGRLLDTKTYTLLSSSGRSS